MAYEMFKVLLVDDDPVVLRLYEKSLRDNHYQVITASSGEEALRIAFQESPDIVLLDLMMPKMSGYEVCTRLRSAPSTADLPIMILTALGGASARQKAQETGADDYMTKGEPVGSVEGRIKMLLKRHIWAHTRSWLAELPGNIAAEYTLRARLAAGLPLAVCYLDLDNLSTFSEQAGIEEGERILWQLARILLREVKEVNQGDFVGYCGWGRFVLITLPERAESLAQTVVRSFEATMREWSGSSSLGIGYPGLAVAVVVAEDGRTIHPGQVTNLGQSLLSEERAEPESSIRVAQL